MLQDSIATRYAQAFFDIAVEDERIDEYGQELRITADAMGMNPEFFRIIRHPGLTHAQKKELMEKILDICSLSRPTQEFLRVLERRGRMDLIREIAGSFLQLADKQKDIVTVIVTSALPLSTAQQEALMNKLSLMIPSVIRLKVQLEPEIIGGLIIRLKDRVIDGSVRGRLNRLRDEMTAGIQMRG